MQENTSKQGMSKRRI